MPLNIAIVGLKLIGIYFMVASIPLFGTTAVTVTYLAQMAPGANSLQTFAVISALVPSGMQMILGLLLFICSESLAKNLISSKMSGSNKVVLSLEDTQAIAFAAIGILITAIALPDLGRVLQNLYYWYANQWAGGKAQGQGNFNWLYSAGVVVQFSIGMALLLHPHGVRNIWSGLRTAGTGPTK